METALTGPPAPRPDAPDIGAPRQIRTFGLRLSKIGGLA